MQSPSAVNIEREWPIPGGLLERLGKPPGEIESRSRALAQEAASRFNGQDAMLASSCIYAAGDTSIVADLAIGGEPAKHGIRALQSGRVLVDIGMVAAGATRIEAEIATAVRFDGARELAERTGTTRAAAGMRLAWDSHGRDGVVVVGNAPTALLAALDLAESEGAPACLIGTCPGFTLAAESKDLLARSPLPHLALRGSRGGSGIATAVLNTIGRLAARER